MYHKKEEKPSSSSVPTYVIKANLNCCEACPLRAKKKLLKLPGVESVVIDREKSLVHVTGTIDPSEIITTIKKWKTMAELVSYSYSNEEHENSYSNSHTTENIKHKHGKNQSGHKRESYIPRKADCSKWSDHKRELYIPPKDVSAISDAICTDIYCRIHPRNQSSKNSLLNRMMWWRQPEQLPNRFHHGYPQPGYGYPHEQYHLEPRMTYPGYDYPQERYQPVHYGTEYPNHDLRPMLGYDNFGEHVDEHNSHSCNFM